MYPTRWMDESHYIKDWYREADARDLKRHHLGTFGKVRKVGKMRKINWNIMMNEKSVKNSVMLKTGGYG